LVGYKWSHAEFNPYATGDQPCASNKSWAAVLRVCVKRHPDYAVAHAVFTSATESILPDECCPDAYLGHQRRAAFDYMVLCRFTNLGVPFIFQQMFTPYVYYGTNGFTNLWFGSTNFPIVTLYATNIAGTLLTTNATLTNTDTLPIYSNTQKTNTTVSLTALYQYFTNLNALPAYTQARVQFNGTPFLFNVTNENTSQHCFYPTNFNAGSGGAGGFTNNTSVNGVIAVSFNFNAGIGLVTTPQITSNMVYYIAPTNTGAGWFYLFTNFTQATASTFGGTVLPAGAVDMTGTASVTPAAQMYVITNLTSFNADAIQLVTGTSKRTGVYDVYFRTPSANSLYYVTGSGMQVGSDGMIFELSSDSIVTTNNVRIATVNDAATATESPRVSVLIQPQ